MLTYCPKCKATLFRSEYDSRETCPFCGYNLNRTHYLMVSVLALVLGAGPWLLKYQFPPDQEYKMWSLSGAMLAVAAVTIVGDVLLRAGGVKKVVRRKITGWGSILCGVLVGILIASITGPRS